MQDWYYATADGQHHGPLPTGEMLALAARGTIGADTLVWREGYAQWRPLAEAGELAPPTMPPAIPAAAPATPASSHPRDRPPRGRGSPDRR